MNFKKSAAVIVAAALFTIAGPAAAAPPYVVEVDGDPSAQPWDLDAVADGSVQMLFHHASSVVAVGCTSLTADGEVDGGTSTLGQIGTIKTTWSGCTGPLGLGLVFDQMPAGPTASPWELVLAGSATSATADTIPGYVDNVDLSVTSDNPLLPCSMRIVGTMDVSLAERVLDSAGPPATYRQELQVNELSGNLILTGVSGCFGLLSNGDTADLVIDLVLDVPAASSSTPINVTP